MSSESVILSPEERRELFQLMVGRLENILESWSSEPRRPRPRSKSWHVARTSSANQEWALHPKRRSGEGL